MTTMEQQWEGFLVKCPLVAQHRDLSLAHALFNMGASCFFAALADNLKGDETREEIYAAIYQLRDEVLAGNAAQLLLAELQQRTR